MLISMPKPTNFVPKKEMFIPYPFSPLFSSQFPQSKWPLTWLELPTTTNSTCGRSNVEPPESYTRNALKGARHWAIKK